MGLKKSKLPWPPEGPLIVLDLECTCSEDGSIPPDRMETIEIGAVAVSRDGLEELGAFSLFVRPLENPTLTDFCTSLTGITQPDVDGGVPFEIGLALFLDFLRSFGLDHFASWGAFDFLQLAREAKRKKLLFPLVEHRNLKRNFADVTSLRTEVSLDRALEHVGLVFEGSKHRALADARNTARLLPHLYRGDSLRTSRTP